MSIAEKLRKKKVEAEKKSKEPTTEIIPDLKSVPDTKKRTDKKSRPPLLKIPELDEVVLFLQDNLDKFPTLPKSFLSRVTGKAKDRWIIEAFVKIQRAILEQE